MLFAAQHAVPARPAGYVLAAFSVQAMTADEVPLEPST
jgi:hypothetical protein